jgi:hypothetical protein
MQRQATPIETIYHMSTFLKAVYLTHEATEIQATSWLSLTASMLVLHGTKFQFQPFIQIKGNFLLKLPLNRTKLAYYYTFIIYQIWILHF